MVDRKDVIVYDSESHACILDGMRLHIGKRFVYPHNEIDKLAKQLEHAKKVAEKTGGGILVITEGVFGMAGDLGKLDEIVALKKDYEFRLLVDDAHGFGTMEKREPAPANSLVFRMKLICTLVLSLNPWQELVVLLPDLKLLSISLPIICVRKFSPNLYQCLW